MKKSITKNYIYNLTYQILIIILPIITTPYLSRVLGAENLGIYSYTLAIATYFITFGSLGVALYGQREIAFEQDNPDKYSKTFWEILIFRFITMSISIVLYYIVFINGTQYQLYYKILLLEIIGNCIDISWFFQGLEEFKKTVFRNTIVKIISLISIFTFVKTKNDLTIYFVIYVLSTLIGNLTLWFYLPKYLVHVNFKDLQIFKHLKPTLTLFVPQIAVQVYTLLDKTMIGTIISDKSEVGYYDQAQKIIKMLLTIITSFGTVMMPRIANTYSKGDKEQIQKYMSNSFCVVFMLAFPLIFGIASVAPAFVPLFFGEGYDKVIILMRVISPIILLIGLSNVTGTQYLLPIKRQTEYTISVICGAIINFIMNMILIPKYGAIGASIGTVIAEFTVTAVQAYFVKKDFDFKKVLLLSKNYIISSIAMFVLCFGLSNLINKNAILSICLQVILGAITYFIILFLMKDQFTIQILKTIKKHRRLPKT